MAKVLVYEVGQVPVEKDLGGLDDMQKVVGGLIQYVDLGAITGVKELHGYDLFCNDEGKLEGLPLNIMFDNDFIAGNFFISKADSEGEQIDLTNDDIKLIKKYIDQDSPNGINERL